MKYSSYNRIKLMEGKNPDIADISNLKFDEYIDMFKNYFIYVKSILSKNGVHINCSMEAEILNDSLSESFLLYFENKLEIKEPAAFKQWICKTAFHKFMNRYKKYKKNDFCDLHDLENLPSDFTYEFDKDYSEEEFFSNLSDYCTCSEIEFLKKHWIEGYTLKDLSTSYGISEAALQQRHKRIMDKLKNKFPLPKK